jgi:hypothetical protein
MQEKNHQSHTKTVINLSKPYHSGKLLVDIKPINSKTIIDIKPIRKLEIKKPENREESKFDTLAGTIKDKVQIETKTEISELNILSDEPVKATLDFDQFSDFSSIFNPPTKTSYRDANDIQLEFREKKNEHQSEVKNPKSVVSKSFVKSLTDINKKTTTNSHISLSHKKPQISIDPLNSASKVLTVVDNNRALAKNINKKRFDLKVKLMQQKHKADLEKFNVIDQFSSKKQSFEEFSKDNYVFKSPGKLDNSSIPKSGFDDSFFKKFDTDSSRINLEQLNDQIHDSKLRKKIRRTNKIKRYSISTTFATIVLIICTLFLTGNAQWLGQITNKNVQASKNSNKKSEKYDQWILKNNSNKYSPPANDLDLDGLNNFEEYLIDSNPVNKSSCNNGFTDNENVINLIDPVFCNPIDFNNKSEVERFAPILNIPESFINIAPASQATIVETKNSKITVSSNSATLVSDIKSNPITGLSNTIIKAEAKTENPKKNIFLSQKIEQYINDNRSYDAYDKFVANPVASDYYIQMSEKFGVPLKYVLAIARSESRFGTDQYNQNGTLNRIGVNKNMYSIGLDDNGGNVGYGTWESGVDAFGRWYDSFNTQGYSDCQKWRIYNPNGDYCQKIENLANEIENYIQS